MDGGSGVRPCVVEGCEKPSSGLGRCANHYKQIQYRRNPEKYRAWSRAQRIRDGDRIRENDRERHRRNPSKARIAATNRKARIRGAGGHFTEAEWKDRLAFYQGRCAYCGEPATSRDHLVPISRGGSNGIENIIPACLTCNLRKHDLMPFTFLQRLARERGMGGSAFDVIVAAEASGGQGPTQPLLFQGAKGPTAEYLVRL